MTGAFDPLLFLDVDGVLIPFGGAASSYPAFPPEPGPDALGVNPLLTRIDPGQGARLAELHGELVWATTWLGEANEWVAPRLGLPPAEVLDWPEPSESEELDERRGLHWKTRAIVARAAGRPFVWVDDEIGAADRAWVAAHHEGPALLYRVDPRIGLVAADYPALDEWLRRPR
ncbi:HAD domain-containing protein [Kitasatospora sp. MMS16-BH015]|uniref:HAD domain-containing protein n=1 Tax=Kitasatospora sp. MMS16-BH015 TaxID=2018025 RepID=UPI000CF28447|nr:HAD domain-containing protein [Kitasatospora sp. MMS16-BH015]